MLADDPFTINENDGLTAMGIGTDMRSLRAGELNHRDVEQLANTLRLFADDLESLLSSAVARR